MLLSLLWINEFRRFLFLLYKTFLLYRIRFMPVQFQSSNSLKPFLVCFFLLFVIFTLNHSSAQNKNAPPALVCSASDFKALAYTTNDVQLREERAKEWLNKYGKSCPLDQIEFILMNQAVWLGTSNTPAISSSIETIYKLKKASSDDLEKAVDKPRGSPANKK